MWYLFTTRWIYWEFILVKNYYNDDEDDNNKNNNNTLDVWYSMCWIILHCKVRDVFTLVFDVLCNVCQLLLWYEITSKKEKAEKKFERRIRWGIWECNLWLNLTFLLHFYIQTPIFEFHFYFITVSKDNFCFVAIFVIL